MPPISADKVTPYTIKSYFKDDAGSDIDIKASNGVLGFIIVGEAAAGTVTLKDDTNTICIIDTGTLGSYPIFTKFDTSLVLTKVGDASVTITYN